MTDLQSAEEVFYSRYDWCLNPILSVQELLHHFSEEISNYPSFDGWQREECKINLYLFACALACTIDDYFGARLLDLYSFYSSVPRLLVWLRAAEWLVNTSRWLFRMVIDWRLWRWRKRWNSRLEEICALLIADADLQNTASTLATVQFPKRLLKWRMRLPEAFRGQDFTHHDVISLIQRFCRSSTTKDRPLVIVGLRNGLLVTAWIDETEQRPLPNSQMVNVVASYVAGRCRKLPLAGDCRHEKRMYRWTGVDEIVTILRAAYGPYIGRLKAAGLRKQLYTYLTSTPTLIDGRMRSQEWLRTPTAVLKADFEHHNFRGAELDIADPAYDLAAAVFEFQWPRELEEQLLTAYLRMSGDRTAAERIIIYKILYASLAMRHAAGRVIAGKEPERYNNIYHHARNFLIYSMNRFCADLINLPRNAKWSDSIFFIDLDGVFDQELLGFPHATQNGLQSLMFLHSNGYSVVLNTGRSTEHVRNYCETYGIPGGFAEFGGAFVDIIGHKEVPLIDAAVAGQLPKCR